MRGPTIDDFVAQLAGLEPVPAGVSAAAVSASFGVALLLKVLAIIRKHGGAEILEGFERGAALELERLGKAAEDDIAAYRAYLQARKVPEEREAALRQAIETPLGAARSAASVLELCAKTAASCPANIAPDLATSATLLSAAVRATLLSVDANTRLVKDQPFRDSVLAERRLLSSAAARFEESVFARLAL